MKDEKNTRDFIENADKYPGAAIDIADDEDVRSAEEKERTATLDNNPRDLGTKQE